MKITSRKSEQEPTGVDAIQGNTGLRSAQLHDTQEHRRDRRQARCTPSHSVEQSRLNRLSANHTKRLGPQSRVSRHRCTHIPTGPPPHTHIRVDGCVGTSGADGHSALQSGHSLQHNHTWQVSSARGVDTRACKGMVHQTPTGNDGGHYSRHSASPAGLPHTNTGHSHRPTVLVLK